jgi:hypothetical protein
MRALLVGTVLLLALSGCFGVAERPALFTVEGHMPVVFQGYDYEGNTAEVGEGRISIQVSPDTDTGTTMATFQSEGRPWRVEFTRFAEAPGKAFHMGGVRNDFAEHGASGNGDALLPTFHALSAGWGEGTVTVDGQPLTDPATGSTTFALHYMVTDTAPRDPQTRKVTKADGATPYDPASPADAKLLPGTMQILLNVQSAAPPAPADTLTLFDDTVTSPQYSREHVLPVGAALGSMSMTITIQPELPSAPVPPPATPPAPARLAFRLLDPAGAEVAAYDYDATMADAPSGVLAVTGPLTVGDYKLQVTGSGVQTAYGVASFLQYQKPLFLHVVYGHVVLG